MRTEVLGDGEPEYAVVSCLHGNETCGWKAIQRLKEKEIEIEKPVKLVMANEKAYKADERYIDADANRSFPGSSDSEVHEEKLAARLLEELEGMKILDIHSTNSREAPFGVVIGPDDVQVELARSAGVERLVDMEFIGGNGLGAYTDCVVVELSKAEGEPVDEAYEVLRNFLAAEGVIQGEYEKTDPEVFEVYMSDGDGHEEFLGKNFSLVEEGEVYARKEDGTELIADEDFYPILMSKEGYPGIRLGFRARKRDI
ncbi:MAG: succinylglutamate desuccinylase/aspartoacylase family protein [Candidatus Nanosalina sp.]